MSDIEKQHLQQKIEEYHLKIEELQRKIEGLYIIIEELSLEMELNMEELQQSEYQLNNI